VPRTPRSSRRAQSRDGSGQGGGVVLWDAGRDRFFLVRAFLIRAEKSPG
jgi:hypothetical protein